jgi:hypothetical protein
MDAKFGLQADRDETRTLMTKQRRSPMSITWNLIESAVEAGHITSKELARLRAVDNESAVRSALTSRAQRTGR